MKKNVLFQSLALCLASCVCMAFLPVHASTKHSSSKPEKHAAKAVAEPREVVLAYDLAADQAGELQKLVERFNGTQKESRVLLRQQDWSQSKPPVMLFLGEEGENRFLDGPAHYKPLWQVMKDARLPLAGGRAPAQMAPAVVDARGRLLALPALGTPVMLYNKAAFRKAGLDPDNPPATWTGLQDALGSLRNKGYCPYASSETRWIHVENTDAWHDNPFASGGSKETGLAINDLLMVKHLAMMGSWVQSKYMYVFGRGNEGDAHFATGECAVLTTSSAAYPSLKRQASFEIGIGALPYHDDIPGAPRNTLADGGGLWLGAGHDKADYLAAARFVQFLLQPEIQEEWQQNLGYLPLGRNGFPQLSVREVKEAAPQNKVAIAELDRKPVSAASRATRLGQRRDVREIVDSELESLWAARKPALAAVDDAVKETRSLLQRRR